MEKRVSQEELWTEARRDTILIVGFGERTGLAAARLFEAHGVHYKISDHADRNVIAPLLAGLGVAPSDVHTGEQSPRQLEGVTKVLVSPGVPRTVPVVAEAERRGIPVWVDLDFLYGFIAHKRIAAITGTDGKTTTTTLTGEILGRRWSVVVAGNIGVSVLAKYEEILACDWLVLEVSSFMLEKVQRFRPNIAAVLNIGEDHIDRYASLDEYAETKCGIVRHCRPGDVLVKNVDDPFLAGFCPSSLRVRTISAASTAADAFFLDGAFHVGGMVIPYAECRLRGQQNVPNVLTAATIALEAGVEPEAIGRVIRSFQGLRHRMQHVGRYRGIDVYEDSKASNVHAVGAALRNFPANVVLILGGRDKGLDFTALRAHAPRIKRLVCYGEHGERIRDAVGIRGALYAYPFEEAVKLATDVCEAGDVLLLSPGCTSWDQFPNYEVRGDVFQQLAARILA